MSDAVTTKHFFTEQWQQRVQLHEIRFMPNAKKVSSASQTRLVRVIIGVWRTSSDDNWRLNGERGLGNWYEKSLKVRTLWKYFTVSGLEWCHTFKVLCTVAIENTFYSSAQKMLSSKVFLFFVWIYKLDEFVLLSLSIFLNWLFQYGVNI